jgi:protein TonB
LAFEAILEANSAGSRGAAERRPARWRRAMLTASLLAHLAALAIALAYSFWQVDELPMPAVSVTLAGSAPPPPPPPPPARRQSSSKPKTKPTQPKPDTLIQPRETPKETPKPQDEPEKDEEGAEKGGVEGGVKGGVEGGVVGGVLGAPLVRDPGPRLVAPQVARALLLIDPNDERYRVSLPPALERAGATLSAIVRVCVSAQGAVTEVRIVRGAGPAVDAQIPSVLGRWRYRALLLDGKPTPFCYPLRYEISAR